MGSPSLAMLGGRMSVELDDRAGRAVGSVIRMSGRILGVDLHLREMVTVREPPSRKAWQTIGRSRLLVLHGYAMGFTLERRGTGSVATFFVDYDLPAGRLIRPLALVLGPAYARWCLARMADECSAGPEGP